MANLPLSDLDYVDEIRELLGIDSTIVSDDAIKRDTVQGQVERDIKGSVTGWAALTGDDIKYLRSAVIYRICAVLCDRLALLQPNREVIGDYEYTLAKLDWVAQAARFDGMSAASLQSITTYVITYVVPVLATPKDTSNVPEWGYI